MVHLSANHTSFARTPLLAHAPIPQLRILLVQLPVSVHAGTSPLVRQPREQRLLVPRARLVHLDQVLVPVNPLVAVRVLALEHSIGRGGPDRRSIGHGVVPGHEAGEGGRDPEVAIGGQYHHDEFYDGIYVNVGQGELRSAEVRSLEGFEVGVDDF